MIPSPCRRNIVFAARQIAGAVLRRRGSMMNGSPFVKRRVMRESAAGMIRYRRRVGKWLLIRSMV